VKTYRYADESVLVLSGAAIMAGQISSEAVLNARLSKYLCAIPHAKHFLTYTFCCCFGDLPDQLLFRSHTNSE